MTTTRETNEALDRLLPWRLLPLPDMGEGCQDCGHGPGCNDDCCPVGL